MCPVRCVTYVSGRSIKSSIASCVFATPFSPVAQCASSSCQFSLRSKLCRPYNVPIKHQRRRTVQRPGNPETRQVALSVQSRLIGGIMQRPSAGMLRLKRARSRSSANWARRGLLASPRC